MKKQKSSGASKVLVILIVFAFMAVAAMGWLWATRYMKMEAAVVQAPVTKRIKINQVPPEASPAQPSAESVGAQQQPSASPESGMAVSEEGEPREPVAPQSVEAPGPVTTEAAAPNAGTSDEEALEEKPEPTAAAQVKDKDEQAPPQEDVSADTADDEPEAARQTAMTDADSSRFNLQVGAFRNKAYAVDAVKKLSKNGYDPFIFEVTDSRLRVWYTVRIGHYDSREEAVSALERFKLKENIDAVVMNAGRL